MFYLTTHSAHFIYGYKASDIWLRTILIVSKETRCRHIGYSLRLTTHGAMDRRIDPSWGGPIELFLVPASAPRLV